LIHQFLHNESQLLSQLKEGDEEAFAKLFNHYKLNIYNVALKFLKSNVLAEEIVQDVFLKVWLKRNEMGDIKDFNAYLFIMARNFIFDRIKKMAYETTAQTDLKDEPFFVDDTEHLVRHHQCEQLLQQAIELLPPQQKEVYHLAKVDGLSHQDISQKMQLSKHTVKKHMATALKAIRSYLNARLNLFTLLLLLTVIFSLL
jgi:RNA polymerase sigma-70 factor (ECF subfamily)